MPGDDMFTKKIAEQAKQEDTVSDITLSEQEKNIQEVFKLSPELEKIGTKEQYTKYLETIFPESKIKDIVWHGSNSELEEKFEEFSLDFIERTDGQGRSTLGKGFYFSPNIRDAEFYSDGWNIYPVVLNIKNPLTYKYDTQNINDEYTRLPVEHRDKYDGILGIDQRFNNIDQYVVFESPQTHILGSKKDIEKFKEFVGKGESKKERQSIEEFLKEKDLEHVPKIETKIFFTNHATAEDGQGVADKLEGNDILIQENAGWDKERLETWHKVASGEYTTEQAIAHEKDRGKPFFWPEYLKPILEKLHGSNKEVVLADIENDDELYKEMYEFFKGNSAYNDLVNREYSYEEMLDRIAGVSELESTMQKERENKILENMKTKLLELLQAKPELQKKENLNILFPMGAFHTRLYHEMKRRGDNVKQESSEKHVFDPRMTVERIIHFKGSERAKEYMPKILLYWLLAKSGIMLKDKAVGGYSNDQIRELLELYKKTTSDQEFKEHAMSWLTEQFKKQK